MPSSRMASMVRPLIAPLVAQKMKAGVSRVPWGVLRRPVRGARGAVEQGVKEKSMRKPELQGIKVLYFRMSMEGERGLFFRVKPDGN